MACGNNKIFLSLRNCITVFTDSLAMGTCYFFLQIEKVVNMTRVFISKKAKEIHLWCFEEMMLGIDILKSNGI